MLRVAVAFACVAGCAARTGAMRVATTAATTAAVHTVDAVEPVAGTDELARLRANLLANEPVALETAGVELARSTGVVELSGERSVDETVASADAVLHVGASAVLLVQTRCGNATVASVHFDGRRWQRVGQFAIVRGARPGQCVRSTVHAEPVALAADPPRELAVASQSIDDVGDRVAGPYLAVFHLAPSGALDPWMEHEPYGSIDDRTGATRVGSFAVIAALPAPRALHVFIAPGQRGTGSAPDDERETRTFVLRGGHLVREPAGAHETR